MSKRVCTHSNVWVIILCRNATCITAQQSELIILSRESVDLVQAMATESAVFSMQSCMRLLKKPPNSRTKNDLLFLSYNLVPALPFLRNMPDFVSARLVQWLRLRTRVRMADEAAAKEQKIAAEETRRRRPSLRLLPPSFPR